MFIKHYKQQSFPSVTTKHTTKQQRPKTKCYRTTGYKGVERTVGDVRLIEKSRTTRGRRVLKSREEDPNPIDPVTFGCPSRSKSRIFVVLGV